MSSAATVRYEGTFDLAWLLPDERVESAGDGSSACIIVSPRGDQRVEIGDEIGVRSNWLGYLTGRFQQVFDLPNDKRPRWTVTDAHAVRALIEEVERGR